MNPIIKYHLPSILWASFILFLTLLPGKSIPEVHIFEIDKLVHFFLFSVLMFLTIYELTKQKQIKVMRYEPITIGYAFSISLGVLIEVMQIFVPGRTFSIYDMIANSIGVFIGHLVFNTVSKKYLLK